MYKLSGFLFLLLLLGGNVLAQVENKPDSTVKDYTSYDTTLPKSGFVDTVHHIAQDTAHHSADTAHHKLTDDLKLAREKAEIDKRWIKNQIAALSSHTMHGRGYVMGGLDSAAKYIVKKFVEFKLKPLKEKRWTQGFAFPVNTFPRRMFMSINGDSLAAGVDFLIDPASPSYNHENLKVEVIDLDKVNIDTEWHHIVASMDAAHAYCFEHIDSFCGRILQMKKREFLRTLPAGCYIIPEDGKLTWSVSRDTMQATVFYVDRVIMPKKMKKLSVDVTSEFLPHARSENIIGTVPGDVKDTFFVFSAHYDHLGMMGDTTYFPGASDNASGVAMLLYLARYFAQHPQHYSMLFIAFAGEEAALMGSEFFVMNPPVPLKSIKFLTNIDIMGDATNGVTVVNATAFPAQYSLLNQLNEKGKYLPAIKSRGKAANSDHYYFTEAGVPSFFIYSDGGPGYYHDVLDRAKELSLNHIDDFAKLMIDFVKEVK